MLKAAVINLALALFLLVTTWFKFSKAEDYVVAFGGFGSKRSVRAVAGNTEGWVQVQSQSRRTVAPYSTQVIDIDDSTNQNGIQISGNDIRLFVYHSDWGRENQFAPIPVSELGTKYIISSCFTGLIYNVHYLVIVAHRQETDVDISFKVHGSTSVNYNGQSYSDGDSMSVTLSAYETVSMFSADELIGTVIHSSHVIAVFIGVMYSRTALSFLYSYGQLMPVEKYGLEYIVACDDSSSSKYKLHIVSEATDTQITFSNGSSFSVDEDGIYRQLLTSNENLYFTTTKPIMALLCKDTDFVIVPPVSDNKKHIVTDVQETVKILSHKDASDIQARNFSQTSFEIEWSNIPQTNYKVGTFSPSSGNVFISSESAKFNALIYSDRYIYNGGFDKVDTQTSTVPTSATESTSTGKNTTVPSKTSLVEYSLPSQILQIIPIYFMVHNYG